MFSFFIIIIYLGHFNPPSLNGKGCKYILLGFINPLIYHTSTAYLSSSPRTLSLLRKVKFDFFSFCDGLKSRRNSLFHVILPLRLGFNPSQSGKTPLKRSFRSRLNARTLEHSPTSTVPTKSPHHSQYSPQYSKTTHQTPTTPPAPPFHQAPPYGRAEYCGSPFGRSFHPARAWS